MAQGGWMYLYLKSAQLAVLLGESLFVHGQIIGNHYPQSQVLTNAHTELF